MSSRAISANQRPPPASLIRPFRALPIVSLYPTITDSETANPAGAGLLWYQDDDLLLDIPARTIVRMGRTADYSHQVCSVAAALEVVGDPWTLLILRDAFAGVRRFEQWQENLGVARNVLAARLKALVAHGVLARRPYSEHPPRFEYVLTAKGRDLSSVLLTLAAWGDRHVYGGPGGPVQYTHRACGCRFHARLVCEACGESVSPGALIRAEGPATATVGEALAEADARRD
jgi:DNA-binding HxlR family transcriptional regulator